MHNSGVLPSRRSRLGSLCEDLVSSPHVRARGRSCGIGSLCHVVAARSQAQACGGGSRRVRNASSINFRRVEHFRIASVVLAFFKFKAPPPERLRRSAPAFLAAAALRPMTRASKYKYTPFGEGRRRSWDVAGRRYVTPPLPPGQGPAVLTVSPPIRSTGHWHH